MRKFLFIVIILLDCMFLYMPVGAIGCQYSSDSYVVNEPTLRAEETEWRYRVYNGQLQKRLWSKTSGRWLTDWMPV